MAFSRKLAEMTEGFVLKKITCPEVEFPRVLAGLERTLVLLPSDFTDSDIELARQIVGFLGKRTSGLISFGKPVEISGAKNIVIDKSDFNLIGWLKRRVLSSFAEYTASIDLSRAFDIPLSALPALAGIGLRIGRDESRAGSIYNVVISGSIEETLKKLLGE